MHKKSLKRIAVICGAFVLGAVSTFASTFKDVTQTHWAYKSIADMQKRGIMLSSSTGEFFPSNIMNYFEAADVLAKATGYVDVNINTNVNETFKQQIINNYENQKAVLASYETKFATWDKRYNQQIAYLLGRGYLTRQELDRFITKGADQKEVKRIISKQEMAVFTVRLLGKEETAKTSFTTTGFSDDGMIVVAYKPHVAYLKSIGFLTPDAKGAFNPNTQVTRALCAKMVSDALLYKEQTTGTGTGTQAPAGNIVTVKKIIAKGDTEYWMILEKDQKTNYYAIKNTTKVTDSTGKEVAITSISLETKASIVTASQNNTEYITSMQLQSPVGDDTASPSSSLTVSGTVERIGVNGDMTILLADDTTKTYLVDASCVVTRNGLTISRSDVKVDDTVSATIANQVIVRLAVGTGSSSNPSSSVLTEGEVIAKMNRLEGYVLTIKHLARTSDLVLDKKVSVKRNGKSADVEDIKIGDKIKEVREGGSITEIIATGIRVSIVGEVRAIRIAASPEVTVKTSEGLETFTISQTTEIYDNNHRQNVFLRDLRLGQSVEVLIDSKEVISLVIQRNTGTIKYMGIVHAIGSKNDYIDVLVDYDPLTEGSRVIKRVMTPATALVELNGKREHRTSLRTGMNVVVTYKYLEDAVPERILIIE